MLYATCLPPNWRPVQLTVPRDPNITDGPSILYRAAALSLATRQELAACPRSLTWLDLRTDEERLLDPRDSPAKELPTSLVPLVGTDTPLNRARTRSVLERLVRGDLSFGDLYVEMLDSAAAQFGAVLEAITEMHGHVVITCQGGRDRTGVLIALILDLVGARRDVIVEDYLRTNDDQASTISRQPDSPGERVLAGYDMTCRASDIEQALDFLADCGGSRRYLAPHLHSERLGAITESLRERIIPASALSTELKGNLG
ncbi:MULTISPECIES: tyrosine-protein phosphatase [Actinomycetes]|uniref:tyrosine-protein phosphatase n=1 Tax=Actinomycetes TaxID=1760 RepID=UPI002AC3EC2D|nr:tyrosine-protein phosphatase [Nesterenkonia sp. HG001]MDZ5079200.1 tyrosine-protein phosphatase [Nesterenkonia sp. HG001]